MTDPAAAVTPRTSNRKKRTSEEAAMMTASFCYSPYSRTILAPVLAPDEYLAVVPYPTPEHQFCVKHTSSGQVAFLAYLQKRVAGTGGRAVQFPAQWNGAFRNTMDVFVEINGVPTAGKSFEQVVELLASSQHYAHSVYRMRDRRYTPPKAGEYDIILSHVMNSTQFYLAENRQGQAAFESYYRPGGHVLLPAELDQVFRNRGDIVVSVNGESALGRPFQTVFHTLNQISAQLAASMMFRSTVVLRMRDIAYRPSNQDPASIPQAAVAVLAAAKRRRRSCDTNAAATVPPSHNQHGQNPPVSGETPPVTSSATTRITTTPRNLGPSFTTTLKNDPRRESPPNQEQQEDDDDKDNVTTVSQSSSKRSHLKSQQTPPDTKRPPLTIRIPNRENKASANNNSTTKKRTTISRSPIPKPSEISQLKPTKESIQDSPLPTVPKVDNSPSTKNDTNHASAKTAHETTDQKDSKRDDDDDDRAVTKNTPVSTKEGSPTVYNQASPSSSFKVLPSSPTDTTEETNDDNVPKAGTLEAPPPPYKEDSNGSDDTPKLVSTYSTQSPELSKVRNLCTPGSGTPYGMMAATPEISTTTTHKQSASSNSVDDARTRQQEWSCSSEPPRKSTKTTTTVIRCPIAEVVLNDRTFGGVVRNQTCGHVYSFLGIQQLLSRQQKKKKGQCPCPVENCRNNNIHPSQLQPLTAEMINSAVSGSSNPSSGASSYLVPPRENSNT